MGLKIIDKIVFVDHDVNEHLHTTNTGNPTTETLEDLNIHSVFKRLKNSAKLSRDRANKKLGDNCPLIYAAKGEQGLSTTLGSAKLLQEHAPTIISEICDSIDGRVDGLVSMPSGFSLADWLLKRIHRETGLPIFQDVFRKSTNAEAIYRAQDLISSASTNWQQGERKKLNNQIKQILKAYSADDNYSAKKIGTNIRHQFDPLQWQSLECAKSFRLLMVDDLFATGSTFIAAKAMLEERGWARPEHAVTWFSGV